MKTLFSRETISMRNTWMGAATLPPTVDQTTRNEIIENVGPAIGKAKELNDLLAWSHDHDPYLKNFFGADQGAFWMGWESVYKYRPVIDGVLARMVKDDPSAWTDLTDEEQNAVSFWPDAVDGLYQIYQEHYDALPSSGKPGGVPAVGVTTPPPPPLATSKKSLVSENVLIGGAIVIGLGVLVYALT